MPSDTLCTKYALRKFLETKYGTIEALITAWGLPSGRWTQWDSTATAHSNELAATADGTSSVFTFTVPGISSGNQITKHSLRVYAGSRFAAFDHCQQLSVGVTNRCTGSVGYIYGNHTLSDPSLATDQSTVDYTTGAITVRFKYPPAAGTQIRVDYTTGGWGTAQGTGFMDTWDLVPGPRVLLDGYKSSSDVWWLSGFHPQQVADMDDFLYWHARRYFLAVRRAIWKADRPHDPDSCATIPGTCAMYFGTTYLWGWGAPTRDKILQAARGVVDVLPAGGFPVGDAYDAIKSNYVFAHWGDRPIASWEGIRSDEQPAGFSETAFAAKYSTGTVSVTNGSDLVSLTGGTWTNAMTNRHFSVAGRTESYPFTYLTATTGRLKRPYEGPTGTGFSYGIWNALNPNSVRAARPDAPTQEARGVMFKNAISAYLSFTFPNGSHPMVGYRWWEWKDNYRQQDNWGLVNYNDDFYDGSIGTPVGKDEWGYPTGGWPLGGYSNFIKHFKEANSYWLNYVPGRVTRRISGDTEFSGRVK
jgi:hypothetical protein